LEQPKLPTELKKKVKIISRPFAMYPSTPVNPLSEIIVPYFRDTKKINGDVHEQLHLFSKIVKEIQAKTEENKAKFYVHAFVYEDHQDLGMKLLLSDFIGKLENSLAAEGLSKNKIIRYTILDRKNALYAPYIRFEVLYD